MIRLITVAAIGEPAADVSAENVRTSTVNRIGQEYDYIIVGGGTAGCVLAARLSEDVSARVLLLEAGSGESVEAMPHPRAWLSLLGGPADWGDVTPINGFTGAPVAIPRGRTLGGSSSINGMNFLRGHCSSYDAWPEQGAQGWGFEELLPHFKRSENAVGRDPSVRGVGGPLTVRPPVEPHPLITAMVDAAVELGYERGNDLSSGLEIAFGRPDANIVDGVRQSATDAYLTPALDRANLDVLTDAFARRVLISGGICNGVEYSTSHGIVEVRCRREVIVSAGAIGSAQLLLLSGLGPADHLRSVGVEPVLDLPGVGMNFHDHPLATVSYSARQKVPIIAANPTGEGVGFIRSDPSLAGPDLQLVFGSFVIPVPDMPLPEDGYTIVFSVMQPHSRGAVRLASADPQALPIVDPNYLADERDVALMLEGLRIARRIGNGTALNPWREYEIHPGIGVDDSDPVALRDYLRRSLRCYFHYAGSCRMGAASDEMAVVDPQLRIRGISGLRVADASIMPSIVSANTNATVYGIAERAAALITDPTP